LALPRAEPENKSVVAGNFGCPNFPLPPALALGMLDLGKLDLDMLDPGLFDQSWLD
jgi:hypothetical protein